MAVTGDSAARKTFEDFRKEQLACKGQSSEIDKMFDFAVCLYAGSAAYILLQNEVQFACERLGKRERRLRKEAISERRDALIMLFRMGQCLYVLFKKLEDAEAYYGGPGPPHRRSIGKDYQLAAEGAGGFAYS